MLPEVFWASVELLLEQDHEAVSAGFLQQGAVGGPQAALESLLDSAGCELVNVCRWLQQRAADHRQPAWPVPLSSRGLWPSAPRAGWVGGVWGVVLQEGCISLCISSKKTNIRWRTASCTVHLVPPPPLKGIR